MPGGFAEVALKVTANIRDAVKGIETVDKALEKTDNRLRSIGQRARAGLGRLAPGQGADLAERAVSGGLTVDSILPTAGIAGLAALFVRKAQEGLARFFDQKIAQAQQAFGLAASGPEAAGTFETVVRKRVEKAKTTQSPLVQLFRDVGPGVSTFHTEAKKEFRTIAESDPYLAASILANLPPSLEGIRGDLERILDEARAKQRQAQRAAEFRQGLQPTGSNATVVQQTTNVYTSFAGVGGEGTLGREVRAVLDRRDRNNGRYVTPYTRG